MVLEIAGTLLAFVSLIALIIGGFVGIEFNNGTYLKRHSFTARFSYRDSMGRNDHRGTIYRAKGGHQRICSIC